MDSTDPQDSLIQAIAELKFTISKAAACEDANRLCADELLSHCQDIAEDIDSIHFDTQTDRKTKLEAETIIKEGRRLRRNLNKKALILLDQRKQSDVSVTTLTNTSQIPTPAPRTKTTTLQKLQVPKFDGDSRKFRPFFDTFHDEVEKNPELSEAAKWIYLRASLEGKAAELVSHLPQIPETRAVALDLLNAHYGGKNKTIAELYRKLQSTPPAQLNDEQLRFTQARVEGILLTLENLGHIVNDNAFIRTIVLDKFPHDFKCTFVTDEDMPLAQIRTMIHQRIKARESLASQSTIPSKISTRPSSSKQNQRMGRNFAERPITCLFCTGLHWSDECPVYKTAESRLKQIPDRCSRCLRPKHEGNCTTEKRCVYCDLTSHNWAVCPKKFPNTVTLAVLEPTPATSLTDSGVYLTFCVDLCTVTHPAHINIRAVIDTGGARNIISQELANRLRIKPDPHSQIEFFTLNGIELPPARRALVPINLQTNDKDYLTIPVYITSSIATDLPTADIQQFRNTFPQYKSLHIPPSGQGQPIQLLLGKDSLSKIFTLSSSVEVDKNIQLLSTRFGWIILGSQSLATHNTSITNLSFHTHTDNDIELMWDLDIIGLGYILDKESTFEEIAIKKFTDSITFENGRYFVGWPWKDYPPNLNENYGLALGRLKSLYRKLAPDPLLLTQYNEIILQQEQNGIIEKVLPATSNTSTIKHYIPHHPVLRPDATSTKLRLVYDASARLTKKDKSLNENLLKGSIWVTALVSMLLRFRRYQTAIIADIRQAFLQIGIQPNDRDAVRFLWLKNHELPPTPNNIQIYRFTRVAFGIISSPFLLYATIRHHIQTNTTCAADTVRTDLYADNLVTSLPPSVDPHQFYAEIQTMFNSMSMEMAKWATNDVNLRNSIPLELQQINTLQTVLGLEWDTQKDNLSLKKVDFTTEEKLPVTKRRALRLTAKIFDPLGWAIPITLLAKSFIRRLWQANVAWDQDIPTTQTEWTSILEQLKQTSRIQITRPFLHSDDSNYKISIHTFVDASAIAYAAVSYITVTKSNHTTSTILAARNRLSPTTKLTIPRLELLAILIGCRLTKQIVHALQFQTQPTIYIWSDSQCALSWINSNKVLPAVVNRQLEEIQSHQNYQFRFVPSEHNFADVASRGSTYHDLQQLNWWTGPSWLIDTKLWPPQRDPTPDSPILDTQLFLPATKTINKTQQSTGLHLPIGVCGITITEFSTLTALLRRTAFCIRALNLLLKTNFLQTQTTYDFNVALKLWLRWMQQTSLPAHPINENKQQLFRNLRVIYDENGLIRCLTRLHNADTEETAKQPVLLVRKNYLIQLIVLQIHTNAKHAGVSQTLALIRLQYWLPQGRREVNQIIRQQCYLCRKSTTTTYAPPDEAPLPEFRVTRAEYPFECTGIDLFGPFRTRPCIPQPATITKQKRWIILFTCTVTRAVHLELIEDISATTILTGIRRFIARRSTPRLIICDSAPQFHLIHRKLLNLWPNVFESAEGIAYFANRQINWKFLPPHSPWMGGHYERLISIIKKAFTTTYNNLIMPDRQFETSIIEIEAMLNSRPLTYVDQSITSTILTPNSFLHVKFPAIPLPTQIDQNRERLLTLWHASQKHLNTFWELWSSDFLLALRERHDKLTKKHNSTTTLPEINDIVLIAEPEKQRCAWRLARVERLIPSADNQIRSVQLVLGNNTRVVRPIIKLAPLHLKADLPPAIGDVTPDKTAFVLHQPTTSSNADQQTSDSDDDAEIIEINLDWDDELPVTATTADKVPSSTST